MPPDEPARKPHTDFQIIAFILTLCSFCAFLLSLISFSLSGPQKEAKEFDQSKQMLIAAKILNPDGYFEILKEDGSLTPARFVPEKKVLVPADEKIPATDDQIRTVSELRIRPLLTDKDGNVFTLEEKQVDLPAYLEAHKKEGYAQTESKLFYAILPNKEKAGSITAAEVAQDLTIPYAYVIPVSGFGLWAPIYGYIALEPNANTVIGTTWYEHAETPGLGANIAAPWWQKQFYGKEIFQLVPGYAPEGIPSTSDKKIFSQKKPNDIEEMSAIPSTSDKKTFSQKKPKFQNAPMGIIVVKGKVRNVYGDSPKAESAVDGMSGATLTGDGVTQAYRNSLNPYREFLIQVHDANLKGRNNGKGPP